MTAIIRAALLAFLLLGCAGTPPHRPARDAAARIDHVIVGTSDLDRGMAEIERLTGVRPAVGGVHPGQGTRNALMSLGEGTYLELLAPDPAQTIDNDELEALRGLTSLTPIGWAVSGRSESALRSRLSATGIALSPSEPGSRRKPDGSVLHWVTFGYDALDDPLAPFFIIWADPALHPSRTSPGNCRLESVSISHPAADRLRSSIVPLGLNVPIAQDSRRRMQLALSCPSGTVRFG